MNKKWEIDEANTVEAAFGAFGKKIVKLNGSEVHNSRKAAPKGGIPFALPDGRQATISLKSQFIGGAEIDLRVDGNLVVETGKKPIECPACRAIAKPFDRFCGKCGQSLPTAEEYKQRGYVKNATGAITVLAVLFLLFGLVMFLATKSQADAGLRKLQGMDPAAVYPTAIDGRSYTVGELRKQLKWEPWGVLIVNLILASIMLALALWGRRSPLPAVLIATATYVVVIVANAIVDPATIGQGLIMKLIIIAFLIKGIKAALALRALNA